MRKTLAVAAREIQERWMLLPTGLALGVMPLVLPAFGLDRDASAALGFTVAMLLGSFAAVLCGWSMLSRDADDGRLAFLFARPVPWPAIWGGKWLAAALLSGVTGLLAAVPWMSVYRSPLGGSWFSSWDAQGWTFGVLSLLSVIGVANLVSTAFRARGRWIALDLALIVLAALAVRRFVAPLVLMGVTFQSAWQQTLAWTPLVMAVFVASAAQLAFGRTDLRRAHRALSIGFWAVVFACLLGAAGWLTWVEAAGPADLAFSSVVRPDPGGRWLFVEGHARRGGFPSLLIDGSGARYVPVGSHLSWRGLEPSFGTGPLAFSADGARAIRWTASAAARSLALELVDLGDRPRLVRSIEVGGPLSSSWLTSVGFAPGGTNVLLVRQASASLMSLPSGQVLATSTLPSGWMVTAARFSSDAAVRLWLQAWDPAGSSDGASVQSSEIRMLDLARGETPKLTAFMTRTRLNWDQLVADARGERLLTLDGGLRLRDGASGAVLSELASEAKVVSAHFLADGRVVALVVERRRLQLRTFSGDGTALGTADLGNATGVPVLGPEIRPGQVVAATGLALPFTSTESVVVDVDGGRVLRRLPGLRPALKGWWLSIEPAPDRITPVAYFSDVEGRLVRIDFATDERRILTGAGAAAGRRLKLT